MLPARGTGKRCRQPRGCHVPHVAPSSTLSFLLLHFLRQSWCGLLFSRLGDTASSATTAAPSPADDASTSEVPLPRSSYSARIF